MFSAPQRQANDTPYKCPCCGSQDAEVWPIRNRTPGTKENGWKSSTTTKYAVRCWTCDSLGPEKSSKSAAEKVGWGNAVNRDDVARDALNNVKYQYYHGAKEGGPDSTKNGTFSFDKGLGLITWTRKP